MSHIIEFDKSVDIFTKFPCHALPCYASNVYCKGLPHLVCFRANTILLSFVLQQDESPP